jgi:hypothetical protein
MYALTRSNRRKTTGARHTQVIDVPKFIMKSGLTDEQIKKANLIKAIGFPEEHPELFIVNTNKFAGRRKFIFHARPTVK